MHPGAFGTFINFDLTIVSFDNVLSQDQLVIRMVTRRYKDL